MSWFGDRELVLTIRRRLIPYLRSFPSVNVWLPACGGGEAAYALAIVLREEALFTRAAIYATDEDGATVSRAQSGVYALEALVGAADAYRAAGGRATLDEYYAVEGDRAVMRPLLRERITFAQHSLGGDASFNEFQLVLCPESMAPADRTVQLVNASLCRFGLIAFRAGEPPLFRLRYERFSGADGILRKTT